MVTRTRLNVTLYVHCLSRYFLDAPRIIVMKWSCSNITPSSNLSIQLSAQNSTKWTRPSARLHPKVMTIFLRAYRHMRHKCARYLPDGMVVTWRQQRTGSRFYPDFKIFRVHKSNMLPYILESNLHPLYSFRGLKNQMRIRIAYGLDSRSRAGFWKYDRAAVRAVRTIK